MPLRLLLKISINLLEEISLLISSKFQLRLFIKKVSLILLLGCLSLQAHYGFPNRYYRMPSKRQKKFFFSYLAKIITKENKKILGERALVEKVLPGGILSVKTHSKYFKAFLKLRKKYKIKSFYSRIDYLKKIDLVPVSQALAQAVVESAWGKSRFVKEANNIFGHWTFGEVGLVPKNRDKNKKNKIQIFSSLEASVDKYLLNLNVNRAYWKFRNLRYKLRARHEDLSGMKLSQTMYNYSGIGKKYLLILKNIIRIYKLQKYDKSHKKLYNYKNSLALSLFLK